MPSFNFSPYKFHAHLARAVKPALAFSKAADITGWRKQLRTKINELLGDIPSVQRPVKAIRLWERQIRCGLIQKIVIQSEPFCDFPAYVCLPENASPPYRWMICLQGHTTGMHNSIAVSRLNEQREEIPPLDRDFAIQCMRNGMGASARPYLNG